MQRCWRLPRLSRDRCVVHHDRTGRLRAESSATDRALRASKTRSDAFRIRSVNGYCHWDNRLAEAINECGAASAGGAKAGASEWRWQNSLSYRSRRAAQHLRRKRRLLRSELRVLCFSAAYPARRIRYGIRGRDMRPLSQEMRRAAGFCSNGHFPRPHSGMELAPVCGATLARPAQLSSLTPEDGIGIQLEGASVILKQPRSF